MTVTFDQARSTVADATGRQPAEYGWQNDQVFVIALDYGDDAPPFDEPDYVVDKTTGKLQLVTGLLGAPPAENLAPIGNPPD